jgi:lysophospholipase L1-like esterase
MSARESSAENYYVALGSSMAAGPGIAPRAPNSPRLAGRSARNYPHLVAAALGLSLIDVTYSGATTANILGEPQFGAPPQLEALDGPGARAQLVTFTNGGNDIGYVPMLAAATVPRPLRRVPLLGARLRALLDPAARDAALRTLEVSMRAVGQTVRAQVPEARVLFVDYLTLLPPVGSPAAPLSPAETDTGRRIADTLERLTATAAAETGCEVVGVAEASRGHHAWSADPWTTRPGLPLPGRAAPLHPNAAGMRAVADLIVDGIG